VSFHLDPVFRDIIECLVSISVCWKSLHLAFMRSSYECIRTFIRISLKSFLVLCLRRFLLSSPSCFQILRIALSEMVRLKSRLILWAPHGLSFSFSWTANFLCFGSILDGLFLGAFFLSSRPLNEPGCHLESHLRIVLGVVLKTLAAGLTP